MADRAGARLPSRRDLLRPDRVLSRGGIGNPDVVLIETERGAVVVKDFGPRSAIVRETIGRFLTRREQRAYRRLAGVAVVPRLLGPVGPYAFALEYRPGRLLSRSLRGRLPEDFLPELEAGVGAMHERGVVHLDLRHRSNVLAGEDGRPVILDLASAICVDPASRFGRAVIALLGWFDRRAVEKWRVRIAPRDQLALPVGGAGADSAAASTAEATSAGSRGASRPM